MPLDFGHFIFFSEGVLIVKLISSKIFPLLKFNSPDFRGNT